MAREPEDAGKPRDLRDALVSLDGEDAPEAVLPELAPATEARTSADEALARDGEARASASEAPAREAPAPAGEDRFRPPALSDERFRAPSLESPALKLELEQPVVAAPAARPPPEAEPEPARCPEHELPEPCAECARRDAPVPGRLARGALRKNPPLRLGIGIALGLGLGFLASQPHAQRAERKVALVRGEADQLRYKNAPELKAECARLDAKAEDLASSAAYSTGAIWLLVAGAAVAGWYRLT